MDGFKVKLQPEEKNLRVHGSGYLPVVGKLKQVLSVREGKLWKLFLCHKEKDAVYLAVPQLNDCKC